MTTVKGHFQPDPYVRDQKSGSGRVVVRKKSRPLDDLVITAHDGSPVKATVEVVNAVKAAYRIGAMRINSVEPVQDAKAQRRARMKAISRVLIETHRDTLAELAK